MSPEQEDAALADWPEPKVCEHLASKVRKARLAGGESQAEFADRAGISVRTYKRFELTGKATLENFIQILRALGRTRYLVLLFPVALPPPAPTVSDRVSAIAARAQLLKMRESDE